MAFLQLSKQHNNRQAYNWLVYDICDRFLVKFSEHYVGDLYDLGCGTRPYEEFFLKHAKSYTGVDWSDTLHSLTADVIADLNVGVPAEDACADTIVSLSVMEHLHTPQVFLAESYRLLRPNGKMILQVPFQWHIHEAPHDYYRYTPFALKHMFGQAGFENVEVHASSGFFTTIFIKCNYFSRKLIRGPKILRWITRSLLSIFWYSNQKLAPLMDRFDRNWSEEAQGYWVLAQKPSAS